MNFECFRDALTAKLQNKVCNMHIELVKFLCTNFEIIVIPKFKVSEMVPHTTADGHKRKIGPKTAKGLLLLSHFKFRTRLLQTAARYGCTVYVCDEPCTSKMCSKCGWMNYKLGGSTVFICPNPFCCAVFDRDVNATYNIRIRFSIIHEQALRDGTPIAAGEASFKAAQAFNDDLYERYKDRVSTHQYQGKRSNARPRPILSLQQSSVGGAHGTDPTAAQHAPSGGSAVSRSRHKRAHSFSSSASSSSSSSSTPTTTTTTPTTTLTTVSVQHQPHKRHAASPSVSASAANDPLAQHGSSGRSGTDGTHPDLSRVREKRPPSDEPLPGVVPRDMRPRLRQGAPPPSDDGAHGGGSVDQAAPSDAAGGVAPAVVAAPTAQHDSEQLPPPVHAAESLPIPHGTLPPPGTAYTSARPPPPQPP